jgi:hypothetical protein
MKKYATLIIIIIRSLVIGAALAYALYVLTHK